MRVTTGCCDLDVTAPLVKLSKDSILRLSFSFLREGGHVVWDVGGVGVGEHVDAHTWVSFRRKSQPAGSLPQAMQDDWREAVSLEYPYDSKVHVENGASSITTTVAGGAGPPALRCALSVFGTPDQPQGAMSEKLAQLQQAFKVLKEAAPTP